MDKVKMYTNRFREFCQNGGISAACENFLAMIPATILMPIMVNSAAEMKIFNIANVLFATGCGTLLFLFITKGRLPGYLGSSFAYIGVTSYICKFMKGESRENILSYIFGTYLFSAFLLLILAILCHIGEQKTNKIIDFLIPPAVMGPVVSLIGLELSAQAVDMAGLSGESFGIKTLIALLVVVFFVFFSVIKKPIFKNAAILSAFVAVSIGCIVFRYWDVSPVLDIPWMTMPDFKFIIPKFSAPFLVMIIPPTFVIFSEHIARKLVTENLKDSLQNPTPNTTLANSVVANGFAFALSVFTQGTPLTLYAENIAVMRINFFVNAMQFVVVSIAAIIFSFVSPALYLIQDIPDPIIGGMSLALMGVIAVPGIKLLVDRKVNYNKISNLLLTSAVLIAGLSEIKVTILATEFKGMSLGLLVGIVLNLVLRLLTALKLNREPFGIDDICEYAQNLGNNILIITHSNAGNEFISTSFYIAKEEPENLFMEISKDLKTWSIQVQTELDMTDEEKRMIHTDYGGFPDTKGVLRIEAEQLNSIRKFEIIRKSYEYILRQKA